MKCISCGKVHTENFCPDCGERADVKKITFTSLIEDTFSTVANMDRGFLYNLKALTIKPQQITLDYIRGKRKGVFNPISYLLLSISIYLIIVTIFDESKEIVTKDEEIKRGLHLVFYETGRFIRQYIKYIWILTIIPLSISMKLIYGRFSFVEHLFISSFIIGHATLFSVISYLIGGTILIADPVLYLVIFWQVFMLFNLHSHSLASLLYSVSVLFSFFVQLIIIVLFMGIFRAYWF